MIIPIRCVTCGNVLANKYRYFQEQVKKKKMCDNIPLDKVQYLTNKNMDKTAEGTILDELKLTSSCCRRHMLTHVDIE